jgi:hypothetical protein
MPTGILRSQWGSGNSQEDQKGAIEPNHILVSEMANVRPDFCFWNGCDLNLPSSDSQLSDSQLAIH